MTLLELSLPNCATTDSISSAVFYGPYRKPCQRRSSLQNLRYGARRHGNIHASQFDQHTGDTKTEGSEEEPPTTKTSFAVLDSCREEQPSVNGWLSGSIITGRPFWRGSLQKDHVICRQAGWHPNLGDGMISGTDRAMMDEEKLTLEEQRVLRPPRHPYHAPLQRQGGDGARCERPGCGESRKGACGHCCYCGKSRLKGEMVRTRGCFATRKRVAGSG
jgi:hypothetical protein